MVQRGRKHSISIQSRGKILSSDPQSFGENTFPVGARVVRSGRVGLYSRPSSLSSDDLDPPITLQLF